MQPCLYLMSNGFQSEYEVGFANGVAAHGLPFALIGSDNTQIDRLAQAVQCLNLRGAQSEGRSKADKALNLLRYLLAYGALALRHRQAIFHFNGLFTMRRGAGVLIEALYARLVIRRWWLSVHNLVPHDADTRWNRWMFKTVYRLPDLLIVHTQNMAKALTAQFGVDPARIMVVEHGIDRFVVPDGSEKSALQARFKLPSCQAMILMFGNMAPYKGPGVLLDALELVTLPSSTMVLLAGRSTSAVLAKELHERIERLQQRGCNVHWLDGFIDDDAVPVLLGAADCMVLPYLHIDQSGVVFSAKSAGLPMIASDVGAFQQYVEPGIDCLVPPGDAKALAHALRQFADDQGGRPREQSVAKAKAAYAWRVTLRAYCERVRQVQQNQRVSA